MVGGFRLPAWDWWIPCGFRHLGNRETAYEKPRMAPTCKIPQRANHADGNRVGIVRGSEPVCIQTAHPPRISYCEWRSIFVLDKYDPGASLSRHCLEGSGVQNSNAACVRSASPAGVGLQCDRNPGARPAALRIMALMRPGLGWN